MQTRQRTLTAELRADALAMLAQSDRSIPEVAAALGISRHTLQYWRRLQLMKSQKKKKAATTERAVPPEKETLEQKIARLERENAQLKKANAQLEMDREILQTAAAFFAKESE